MARADPAEKWKKEVELLRLKINEYETTIANLKSDDSTQDAKIENLNKINGQKVRALMQSIQELKKQNASIRALNKENNRSKLIEKLKTELVQQEIAIQALRDIINDNDRCDEQIITYLNKGPPRVRPLSREEMKIKIRKLESKLGITKKSIGDKAVDDLSSMLSSAHTQDEEVKIIDPLQNEKIVELVEQIQNLQLDIRGKDATIEHLRGQIRKLQDELVRYKNEQGEDRILGFKMSGIENENRNLHEEISKHSNNVGELQIQLENAILEIRAKNELINSLKKRVDEMSSSRNMKEKDVDKLRKELKQAMDTIKIKETENIKIKDEKDRLVENVERKDNEIEELRIRLENAQSHHPPSVIIKDNSEAKDLEIEMLKKMIDDLKSSSNIPETFMAAEEAEIEMYNEKTKMLFLQVAELQEENDQLKDEIAQLRQLNAAHKAQVKETVVIDKTKELSDQINELQMDNNRNIKELANARAEIKRLKDKLQGVEEEARRQEKERQEREEENKKHAEEMEKLKKFHSDILLRKREASDKNNDIIEEIKVNFNMVLKKNKIMIPPGSFEANKFLRLSDNLTAKMCKK
ncbi:hypothetical protein SteCoe_22500 [Stentor coeruleus]|uniref:Uncharacterized protein n=1 Tax=Stentor coeruleus TaxID=5963 RepID=A0A1R2BM33_9CILI|nr:hypothetical protein SteCoe_22500 [Stentor coeruleus]